MNEFIQIDNRRYFVFFAIVSFDDVAYFKDIGIRARLSKKKKISNTRGKGGRVSKRINFPWKIESPVTT